MKPLSNYDGTILLTRLGIVEQSIAKLSKQLIDLRKDFEKVKAYQDQIIQWGGFY